MHEVDAVKPVTRFTSPTASQLRPLHHINVPKRLVYSRRPHTCTTRLARIARVNELNKKQVGARLYREPRGHPSTKHPGSPLTALVPCAELAHEPQHEVSHRCGEEYEPHEVVLPPRGKLLQSEQDATHRRPESRCYARCRAARHQIPPVLVIF